MGLVGEAGIEDEFAGYVELGGYDRKVLDVGDSVLLAVIKIKKK